MSEMSDRVGVPAGRTAAAAASMFDAVEGLRNRRALVALLGCLAAGVVVSMLLGRLGAFGALLGALFWLLAVATGVNAAGALLMQQARRTEPRGLVEALIHGLQCVPKLIVLGFGLLLIEIAVFVVLALLMLLCKIPYLGAVLFVVVFPLSVVVGGITIVGLAVCLLLALPAIWEGLPLRRAIAQVLEIARSRLVSTLLLLAVLTLVCMAVGFIVFSILGAGVVPTIGLAASILGDGAGGALAPLGGLHGGAYGVFGAGLGVNGGHVIAAVIGGALLWALSTALIGLVYLLGLDLVYLRLTDDIDASAAETAWMRRFDDARRQTADLGGRARATAQRLRERAAASTPESARQSTVGPTTPYDAAAAHLSAPDAPAAPAAPSEPASDIARDTPHAAPPVAAPALTIACANCGAACTSDDLFCGVCGHRLK